MGFLFFQNEKCVAGFIILLLFEVMARSLQCRWCITTERKGGPCSLSWNWRVVGGQPHYLNRNLDFFLIQSLPICYGPSCTQFNTVLIPSREMQTKPSLLCKEPVVTATFLQQWCDCQSSIHLCCVLERHCCHLIFFCSFLWADWSHITICFSHSEGSICYNLLWLWVDGRSESERKHFSQNNVSFQRHVTTGNAI